MKRIINFFSVKKTIQLSRLNITILILSGIARSLIPFLDDQKQLFASAYQADILNQYFPLNVFNQWDMKPWPTRLVYYMSYLILEPIYQNKLLFIVSIQGLTLILIWKTLKSLTSLLDESVRKYFINFSFFALILTTPTIFLQIEFIAVILCLFAFKLLNHDKKSIRYSAELILAFVTALKGITILFSAFTLLMCLVTRAESRSSKVHFFFRNSILNLFSLAFVSRDVISSATAQGAFGDKNINLISLSNLEYIYLGLKGALIDMPFLFYLPVILIFLLLNKRTFSVAVLIALICAIYLASLIYQINFTYHYTFFLLVLILSLLILNANARQIFTASNFIVITMIVAVLTKYWIPIIPKYPQFDLVTASNSKIATAYNDLDAERRVFAHIQNRIGNGDILFLTDGIVNFYLKNRSACIEYFPVHFQRSFMYPDSERIKESFRFKNFVECASGYQGKYLLLQTSWIPAAKVDFLLKSNFDLLLDVSTGIREYSLYARRI